MTGNQRNRFPENLIMDIAGKSIEDGFETPQIMITRVKYLINATGSNEVNFIIPT